MNLTFRSLALRWMPKRFYTRLLGAATKTGLSARMIPWYARHFHINLDELDQNIDAYKTLASFFTRHLAPHARAIGRPLVSPVDGVVSQIERLQGDTLIQVKGNPYSLTSLLCDKAASQAYQDGYYITIYLSPRDYHRIHAPMDCEAIRCDHVPGTLYPVNEQGVRWVQGLFVKNERVVTYFRTRQGSFAMVKVGAAGVGTVCVPYGPDFPRTHRRREKRRTRLFSTHFTTGQEIGFFALGSTVLLLFPREFPVKWLVSVGDSVRMGQQIVDIQVPLQDK